MAPHDSCALEEQADEDDEDDTMNLGDDSHVSALLVVTFTI